MKLSQLFLFFLAATLATTACKSTKKTTTTTTQTTPTTPTNTTTNTPTNTTTTPLSITAILDMMDANAPVATRLSGDGNVDIESTQLNQSANTMIRFRRDSVIWMNVKKFGFNVARAQITRDSVFMINYFQSSYIAQPLSYVEQKFGLPADFDLLQNFLLGKPIFLTDKKQLTLNTPKENAVILRGSNDRWTAEYQFDWTSKQLTEMTFSEQKAQRTLKISYQNYAPLADADGKQRPFAYLRTITIESPQTGKAKVAIEIEAESLEVNVVKSIKFEIPSDYKRID